MNIFLTGGTGFIGSHFLALALEKGHQVLALRRTHLSCPVIDLPRQPQWIESELHELIPNKLESCEVVVHLASAGVSPKQAPWLELVEANVLGSAHLIAAVQEAGIRRVVVAGTCHEYGSSAMRHERIPPNAPLEPYNLYGASKAAAYHLLSSYARLYKLQMYYGRLFNVYGEGQYSGNFWPSLCNAAKNGENFPMTKGTQIRDFTPVSQVAAALLNACERQDLQFGIPVVENIGTGNPQTLLAFAQQEWQRLKAPGQLLLGAHIERENEPQRFTPEI